MTDSTDAIPATLAPPPEPAPAYDEHAIPPDNEQTQRLRALIAAEREKQGPEESDFDFFVNPDEVQELPLPQLPPQANGKPHTLLVRQNLTFSESLKLQSAGLIVAATGPAPSTNGRSGGRQAPASPGVELDFEKFRMAKIMTWVQGWSFARKVGGSYVPVPFTEDNVRKLQPYVASVLTEALDDYTAKLESGKGHGVPPKGGGPTSA